MEKVGNILEYGERPCSSCQGQREVRDIRPCPKYGKVVSRLPGRVCPDCGTTRKNGHQYLDTGNMKPCRCGTGFQTEDRYSRLPDGIFQGLAFQVTRNESRPQTFNEAYLGMGSIESVTDYGEHTRLSDAELIAKVKDGNYYTQACKVVDKDNRFCDYLMIATNNSGYTVKAIWEGE
jgi:ribosomal protein L32